MSEPKYKFRIDEPRPEIPAAKSFGAVLAAAQVRKLWYQQGWFWGGMSAITAVVVSSVAWMYQGDQKAAAPVAAPKAIAAKSETIVPLTDTIVSKQNTVAFLPLRTAKPDLSELLSAKGFEITSIASKPFVDVPSYLEPYSVAKANTAGKTPVLIGLPYDTIVVYNAEKAGTLKLKNGAVLEYADSNWIAENGATVTGTTYFLYREVRNQAQMVMAGIPFVSGKEAWENNGAFEIRAISNGADIRIHKSKPVLLDFGVIQNQNRFSGYEFNPFQLNWEAMDIADVSTSKTVHSDGDVSPSDDSHGTRTVSRLVRHKGFWGYIRDLFHKPVYETDTISYRNSDYSRMNAATNSYTPIAGMRSFEIHQFGWFGSGDGNGKSSASATFNCNPNTSWMFNDGVYQVFLNSNKVIYFSSAKIATFRVSAGDQCMLIAFSRTTGQVAVMGAKEFNLQVKQPLLHPQKGMIHAGDRNLILQTQNTTIKTVADLQGLMVKVGK